MSARLLRFSQYASPALAYWYLYLYSKRKVTLCASDAGGIFVNDLKINGRLKREDGLLV